MKKLFINIGILHFFTFCVLFSPHVFAQKETEEMLRAPIASKFVIFTFKSTNNLSYSIDSYEGESNSDPVESGIVSVLIAKRKPGVSVLMDFLNPLRYKVSFSDTAILDPSMTAINTLGEAIGAMTKMTGSIPASASAAATANAVPVPLAAYAKAANPSQEQLNLINSLQAPPLVDWKYELLTELRSEIYPYKEVLALGDAIKKCSDEFYGSTDKPTMQYNATIIGVFQPLAAADDLIEFSRQYDLLKVLTEKTAPELNNQSQGYINELAALVKNLKPADAAGDVNKAFIDYTKEALAKFIMELNDLQKKRVELAVSLAELSKKIKPIIPAKSDLMFKNNAIKIGYTKGELEKIHISTISIKYEEVKFKDNTIEFTPDDSKSSSFKLRVRRYTPVVIELSGGVFYSNLSYPQYTTTEVGGNTVVARSKDVRVPVVAATALNLIINSIDLNLVHPLIQVGVGTGQDRPSLLAGIGFKISGSKNICISGGPIWTWKKEPVTLSENSVLTGGDLQLQNDMKYFLDPTPKMYVGIQYNF